MSVSGGREQFSSFLQCCLVISTDISTRGTKRHILRECYVVSCSQFIFTRFLEIRCLWHALIIGSYSHSALDITIFARWFFESKLPICLTEEPYVIVLAVRCAHWAELKLVCICLARKMISCKNSVKKSIWSEKHQMFWNKFLNGMDIQ